jgi:hypothetical protein
VPIVGSSRAGQRSSRAAGADVFPAVPHQLWHCHSLREAAKPLYEADRHAKKERNKRGRGVRRRERQCEGRTAPEAQAVRGSCSAVRRALTAAGQPPVAASGLKLHARLTALADRLARVDKRGPDPRRADASPRFSKKV